MKTAHSLEIYCAIIQQCEAGITQCGIDSLGVVINGRQNSEVKEMNMVRCHSEQTLNPTRNVSS